mgnify:CR=1 FL=1
MENTIKFSETKTHTEQKVLITYTNGESSEIWVRDTSQLRYDIREAARLNEKSKRWRPLPKNAYRSHRRQHGVRVTMDGRTVASVVNLGEPAVIESCDILF